MSIEDDLNVFIVLDSSFKEDIILEKELVLIQSILPEILQEIMIQSEMNKE